MVLNLPSTTHGLESRVSSCSSHIFQHDTKTSIVRFQPLEGLGSFHRNLMRSSSLSMVKISSWRAMRAMPSISLGYFTSRI
ncbi:hypothetical protein JB92DRAFT_2969850 [Gautieria morchelliformis]|nr:hypothetical protein JB92DRAFT_2969850 [Gautieria morchelliformis]